MKKIFNIITVILFIFIIFWLGSLIKCEIITYQHYNEFSEIYKENTMISEIDYFKVLEYGDNKARIYFVSVNKGAGDIFIFKKENNKWQYSSWEKTVRSNEGSASEVVWPYWWHFIYGGL